MNDIDLSVVIVNYNVKEFVSNLIESVKKAAHSLNIEILISDNASQDGSPQYIREKYPEVILIENKENLGFGKANNRALEISKGKYILIINPDTLVQEDTFIKMINFFEENPDAGLAGCKILNPDGTLQLACRRSFPGPWTSFTKVSGLSSVFPKSRIFARYNLTYLDEDKTYEVDAVSGSFMMMKREVYNKIGGFDEQFFMYGEDLDLCYRVQKAGYKVFYVHNTTIIHYKGESTKRSSIDETKYFYNAQHLFVKKHLSSSLLVEFILLFAIYVNKIISYLVKRKLVLSSVILDFVFFDLSLFVAGLIYPKLAVFHGIPKAGLLVAYTIPAAIHIICASLLKDYKKDTLSVLKNFSAIFLSFFFVATLTYFFKEYAYSRGVLLLTYIILFFSLSFWRIVYKIVFGIGSKSGRLNAKRTLVAGFNESSVKIADRLKNSSEDIREIIGLLGEKNIQIGEKAGEYEIIASFENISKAVSEYQINEVIFPTEFVPYNVMMELVAKCKDEIVEFKLIGNNYDFLVGKSSVQLFNEIPLIRIDYNISRFSNKFLKRTFDIILSLPILVLIYPFVFLGHKISKSKNEISGLILKVPKVLAGKLSFVGPKDTGTKEMYFGRAGLTGLWSLESYRTMDADKLNIFYAKNQNIWFDLEILSKALTALLRK